MVAVFPRLAGRDAGRPERSAGRPESRPANHAAPPTMPPRQPCRPANHAAAPTMPPRALPARAHCPPARLDAAPILPPCAHVPPPPRMTRRGHRFHAYHTWHAGLTRSGRPGSGPHCRGFPRCTIGTRPSRNVRTITFFPAKLNASCCRSSGYQTAPCATVQSRCPTRSASQLNTAPSARGTSRCPSTRLAATPLNLRLNAGKRSPLKTGSRFPTPGFRPGAAP